MSQNLLSTAVVIGALRVEICFVMMPGFLFTFEIIPIFQERLFFHS